MTPLLSLPDLEKEQSSLVTSFARDSQLGKVNALAPSVLAFPKWVLQSLFLQVLCEKCSMAQCFGNTVPLS